MAQEPRFLFWVISLIIMMTHNFVNIIVAENNPLPGYSLICNAEDLSILKLELWKNKRKFLYS